MKKLFLLLAFFATILILSKVSFAAEEVAVDSTVPCACPHCGCSEALPFANPPYPQPRIFGNRLAAFANRNPIAHRTPQVWLGAEPSEVSEADVTYPYPHANFRARRAARLASPPFQVPGAGAAQPVVIDASDMPGVATSFGRAGRMSNAHPHVPGPVINFLSAVRTPHPYDPYAGAYPICPHCVDPQILLQQ